MSLSLISDLFEIRSRKSFSANDITLWLVDALGKLYGIKATQIQTEVIIRGKSKGRADLVVQDSVGIETKRHLEEELVYAEVQVTRILEKLEQEGDVSPVGIATDGQAWRFYVLAKGKPFVFFSFSLKETSEDAELDSNIWLGLTTLRKQKERPAPTAEAVAEAFRPAGPAFNEARTWLSTRISELVSNNPVAFTSKFRPWFELFSFVYNDFQGRCQGMAEYGPDLSPIVTDLKKLDAFAKLNGQTLKGGIELFIRHTYLALLAKTLSTLVTLGEEGVAKILLKDPTSIITGKAVAQNGVYISDDNDFFVWPAEGSDPGKLIGALLRPLHRFSDEYTDDVFRHLYEDVVDSDTRHELGEFYTPKWMTQLIIENTVDDKSDSVLDPACGSGTFLVFALRKKVELLAKEKRVVYDDVGKLLDEVWGIDVNPLSVTLAKTNLYLTVTYLLKGHQQLPEIRPRVYVADTFVLPRFTDAEQRQLAGGTVSSVISAPVTPQISVPILQTISPDESIHWINVVGDALENGTELPVDATREDLAQFQLALVRAMKELRQKYGDNLWKFVLRNYGIPPLLRHKFKVVVGNPPWLSFREARESIQETMETIAKEYEVRPNVQTKTSFNLAVAFFLASSDFVKPIGRIGFVFPLSVLDSAAHGPFIALLTSGDKFELKKAFDLEGVSPYPFPHTLPSAILIAEVKK